MITVFFNESGYCIDGEGVEIARRCSPALTERGDRIFQRSHHMYKVLHLALREFPDIPVQEDVMVYNASRIIDELNGRIAPLDDTCQEWLNSIKRDLVPAIKSVVFFRKKPESQVRASIDDAHQDVLGTLTRQERDKLIESRTTDIEKRVSARKQNVLNNFKQNWLNEK